MPKKAKKKVVSRIKYSHKKSPIGYFFYRRVVIVSILAAFFLTALFALTQTKTFFFLTTGKEQFSAYDPSQTVGYFDGQQVQVPPVNLNAFAQGENSGTRVLGDTTNKRIEVDLTNQRVYAYEGNTKVYDFVVSTGKWHYTPDGEFTIERRVPVQTMSGGNCAIHTCYYLPGVKYVQYFGNSQTPWWQGYSFHAAYWHNNFGHPMSHGCINMKTADAETLWNWTGDVGTHVTIYGTTPTT